METEVNIPGPACDYTVITEGSVHTRDQVTKISPDAFLQEKIKDLADSELHRGKGGTFMEAVSTGDDQREASSISQEEKPVEIDAKGEQTPEEMIQQNRAQKQGDVSINQNEKSEKMESGKGDDEAATTREDSLQNPVDGSPTTEIVTAHNSPEVGDEIDESLAQKNGSQTLQDEQPKDNTEYYSETENGETNSGERESEEENIVEPLHVAPEDTEASGLGQEIDASLSSDHSPTADPQVNPDDKTVDGDERNVNTVEIQATIDSDEKVDEELRKHDDLQVTGDQNTGTTETEQSTENEATNSGETESEVEETVKSLPVVALDDTETSNSGKEIDTSLLSDHSPTADLQDDNEDNKTVDGAEQDVKIEIQETIDSDEKTEEELSNLDDGLQVIGDQNTETSGPSATSGDGEKERSIDLANVMEETSEQKDVAAAEVNSSTYVDDSQIKHEEPIKKGIEEQSPTEENFTAKANDAEASTMKDAQIGDDYLRPFEHVDAEQNKKSSTLLEKETAQPIEEAPTNPEDKACDMSEDAEQHCSPDNQILAAGKDITKRQPNDAFEEEHTPEVNVRQIEQEKHLEKETENSLSNEASTTEVNDAASLFVHEDQTEDGFVQKVDISDGKKDCGSVSSDKEREVTSVETIVDVNSTNDEIPSNREQSSSNGKGDEAATTPPSRAELLSDLVHESVAEAPEKDNQEGDDEAAITTGDTELLSDPAHEPVTEAADNKENSELLFDVVHEPVAEVEEIKKGGLCESENMGINEGDAELEVENEVKSSNIGSHDIKESGFGEEAEQIVETLELKGTEEKSAEEKSGRVDDSWAEEEYSRNDNGNPSNLATDTLETTSVNDLTLPNLIKTEDEEIASLKEVDTEEPVVDHGKQNTDEDQNSESITRDVPENQKGIPSEQTNEGPIDLAGNEEAREDVVTNDAKSLAEALIEKTDDEEASKMNESQKGDECLRESENITNGTNAEIKPEPEVKVTASPEGIVETEDVCSRESEYVSKEKDVESDPEPEITKVPALNEGTEQTGDEQTRESENKKNIDNPENEEKSLLDSNEDTDEAGDEFLRESENFNSEEKVESNPEPEANKIPASSEGTERLRDEYGDSETLNDEKNVEYNPEKEVDRVSTSQEGTENVFAPLEQTLKADSQVTTINETNEVDGSRMTSAKESEREIETTSMGEEASADESNDVETLVIKEGQSTENPREAETSNNVEEVQSVELNKEMEDLAHKTPPDEKTSDADHVVLTEEQNATVDPQVTTDNQEHEAEEVALEKVDETITHGFSEASTPISESAGQTCNRDEGLIEPVPMLSTNVTESELMHKAPVDENATDSERATTHDVVTSIEGHQTETRSINEQVLTETSKEDTSDVTEEKELDKPDANEETSKDDVTAEILDKDGARQSHNLGKDDEKLDNNDDEQTISHETSAENILEVEEKFISSQEQTDLPNESASPQDRETEHIKPYEVEMKQEAVDDKNVLTSVEGNPEKSMTTVEESYGTLERSIENVSEQPYLTETSKENVDDESSSVEKGEYIKEKENFDDGRKDDTDVQDIIVSSDREKEAQSNETLHDPEEKIVQVNKESETASNEFKKQTSDEQRNLDACSEVKTNETADIVEEEEIQYTGSNAAESESNANTSDETGNEVQLQSVEDSTESNITSIEAEEQLPAKLSHDLISEVSPETGILSDANEKGKHCAEYSMELGEEDAPKGPENLLSNSNKNGINEVLDNNKGTEMTLESETTEENHEAQQTTEEETFEEISSEIKANDIVPEEDFESKENMHEAKDTAKVDLEEKKIVEKATENQSVINTISELQVKAEEENLEESAPEIKPHDIIPEEYGVSKENMDEAKDETTIELEEKMIAEEDTENQIANKISQLQKTAEEEKETASEIRQNDNVPAENFESKEKMDGVQGKTKVELEEKTAVEEDIENRRPSSYDEEVMIESKPEGEITTEDEPRTKEANEAGKNQNEQGFNNYIETDEKLAQQAEIFSPANGGADRTVSTEPKEASQEANREMETETSSNETQDDEELEINKVKSHPNIYKEELVAEVQLTDEAQHDDTAFEVSEEADIKVADEEAKAIDANDLTNVKQMEQEKNYILKAEELGKEPEVIEKVQTSGGISKAEEDKTDEEKSIPEGLETKTEDLETEDISGPNQIIPGEKEIAQINRTDLSNEIDHVALSNKESKEIDEPDLSKIILESTPQEPDVIAKAEIVEAIEDKKAEPEFDDTLSKITQPKEDDFHCLDTGKGEITAYIPTNEEVFKICEQAEDKTSEGKEINLVTDEEIIGEIRPKESIVQEEKSILDTQEKAPSSDQEYVKAEGDGPINSTTDTKEILEPKDMDINVETLSKVQSCEVISETKEAIAEEDQGLVAVETTSNQNLVDERFDATNTTNEKAENPKEQMSEKIADKGGDMGSHLLDSCKKELITESKIDQEQGKSPNATSEKLDCDEENTLEADSNVLEDNHVPMASAESNSSDATKEEETLPPAQEEHVVLEDCAENAKSEKSIGNENLSVIQHGFSSEHASQCEEAKPFDPEIEKPFLPDLQQESLKKKDHSSDNKEYLHQKGQNEADHEDANTDEEKDDKVESGEHKQSSAGLETPVMVDAEDLDVKAAHKKTHNLLSGVGSKVKHSIAKVKKAITGKSSHHKPPSAKQYDKN